MRERERVYLQRVVCVWMRVCVCECDMCEKEKERVINE